MFRHTFSVIGQRFVYVYAVFYVGMIEYLYFFYVFVSVF